ncbi:MAG: hypothetical protein JW820_14760 [Spirochaetales bacterium]|nr:hypothetical protein [Spirochaetales bacterium]
MKKKLSSLYYVIPVVYVAVIALFVYMQFASGQSFEEKVGTVTISGSYARKLTGGQHLRRIEVRMRDLSLPIDSASPILAGFGEVQDKRIQPVALATFAEGFEIECEDGLLLRFELGAGAGEALTVRFIIPNALGTPSRLSLPFELQEQREVREVPGIPLFELSGQIGRWYVSLPEGSGLDEQQQRIVLRVPEGGASAVAGFERLETPEEPYYYWFSRQARLAGADEFTAELEGFLDRAYGAWSRLAAQEPVDPALAGPVGISLLSESVRRGEYRTMQALVARGIRRILRSNPQAQIDYAGSCYIGDLPSFLRWRQAEALEKVRLLTELIRQADLSLFSRPRLIPFIVNHAPFALAEEVLRLADSVDLESEALIDVLNITRTYVEGFEVLGLGESTRERVALAVQKRIIPGIRAADGELYFVLAGSGGPSIAVDLYICAQAGTVLREAGALLAEPAYTQLGRNLILSVLRQADEAGTVPAAGRLGPEGLVAEVERLPPEGLYPLVAQERYAPEEYPLYAFLYPGSWILTAAKLGPVQIDPQEQRYRFSFPVAQTHYLLIQGVRRPSSLLMHGIPWKTDPEYFMYSDGWAYQEDTQSLFVKLTHRQELEELVLGY